VTVREEADLDAIPPAWLQELMRLTKEVVPKDYIGQIEINLFRGVISNVNLKRSYKDKRGRHG
jgi:hypothetical protein